ncbi:MULTISPECIES: CRISPR-associated helicase Cas3' [Methanothermobacter]|uniref:CRISPR-associated helicase Cas3' n=1 Tax=Methanothermobacter TaxID=145260 RepID=UPI00092D9640|nr:MULTISPECIES: CRISPR-associated helicase Cas3' [Methanothermobacter]MDI6702056.1 CRISPR-associated helicase Cas3' [Methanothermobacter wolfeii]SCM58166.1 CRISPR-associated nuclease/helicase Cas3 [Methanothermobacter wolfeii]
MNLSDTLRAKSSDQPNYLLKEHLKETVERINDFYDFFNKNKDRFTYDIDDRTFSGLAMAAIIHDLGKVDYNFQRKLMTQEELEGESWRLIDEVLAPLKSIKRSPRHEILSVIWSIFLMGNDDVDAKMRTAILLHHYNEYFINEKDLMELVFTYKDTFETYLSFILEKGEVLEGFLLEVLDYIGSTIKSELIDSAIHLLKSSMDFRRAEELLRRIREYDDDISEMAAFYEPEKDSIDFLVISGILRRADYSASADTRIESFDPQVYLDVNERIISRFGKDVWQSNLLQEVGRSDKMILIAPTGSGKTEFSLLWAAENGRKLLYTLPLRVALNDIFMRLRGNEGYFEPLGVDILHSTAFIEYLKEEKGGREIDVDAMLTSARMLSSPVLLTTPDQTLLTSLNYFGSDKVISTYPFSSVVIDEIQTYDEEMAAIIIKTLGIINNLKGNVLVMTATLPPYFTSFFEAMNFRVVDVATATNNNIKNLDMKRHRFKLIDKPMFDDELEASDEIQNFIQDNSGKNILIVVNNVRKAIELYRNHSEDENAYLLHSRILENEKSERIRDIKEKKEKGERLIVISTQMIEASVDIDFDIMITEISTIDSQIQRWGRVYRNRHGHYSSQDPNIIIFTGADKRTKRIYDAKVLKATIHVLRDYEGQLLDYRQEKRMVDETFDYRINGFSLREIYEKRIHDILEDLDYFEVEKKSQAQKIFRKMAGYKVFIPDLVMQYSDSETEKLFAELIKKDFKTWKDILEEIKSLTDNELSIWDLKRTLYDYSINIPIFYEEKSDFWARTVGEFRGFYIWGNISSEKLEDLKELGADSIFEETESPFIS